jgi:hypothetical protein
MTFAKDDAPTEFKETVKPRKTDAETEQRLQKMLQGAFAGLPTPLKYILTAEGKTRRLGKSPRRRTTRQKKEQVS